MQSLAGKVMAVATESAGLLDKVHLVRRRMGVVAARALPLFKGKMNKGLV